MYNSCCLVHSKNTVSSFLGGSLWFIGVSLSECPQEKHLDDASSGVIHKFVLLTDTDFLLTIHHQNSQRKRIIYAAGILPWERFYCVLSWTLGDFQEGMKGCQRQREKSDKHENYIANHPSLFAKTILYLDSYPASFCVVEKVHPHSTQLSLTKIIEELTIPIITVEMELVIAITVLLIYSSH